MGSPAIFSGAYTKLLSSSGIQKSDGTILNYNGNINYIANYEGAVNTTGWNTYSNTAANIPSSGTGGTSTGLTLSRVTASPLRSPACLQLVQTNSTNIQGKGVSYDFTIDPADQAKPLSVQFDFNASSTFVAANGITAPLNDGTTTTNAGNSDIEVFLYDVTNSQLIYCTPQVIAANGANNFTFKGIFQTASNSTSYRLIFHVATANANATGWTFKFANVYVGPQIVLQGPPVTDWVPYTPTFTGFGTVTGIEFISRRNGDTLEVLGKFTSGTTTATEARITLGFNGSNNNVTSSDTTKIASIKQVGYIVQSAASASQLNVLIEPSTGYFTFGKQDGTTAGLTKENGSGAFSNTTTFSFFASTPISGWSSTTLMSNDASTRVVAARITGATATITGSPSLLTFTTVQNDTHGSYNSGIYTIPVSGFYNFSGAAYITASSIGIGQGVYFDLFNITTSSIIEATQFTYQGTNTTATSYSFNFQSVYLTAGVQVEIRVANSATTPSISASSVNNFLQIQQVLGPSAISATEKVFAQYTSTSTASVSTTTPVTYGTKIQDSHSAFSGTVFTAPRSGTYILNATFFVNTASYTPRVYKNGSFLYQGTQGTSASIAAINNQIFLNAEDTIEIRADNTYTLANTATIAYFMISSQGGI